MNRKTFLTGGLAALLILGGLTGCGDGVDQDNGISDGEQKDAVDNDTEQDAKDAMQEAKENMAEAKKNIEETLKEKGVGDGVDQDNGIDDGEKKDELDNKEE
ncbi:hypothetical protein ACFFHH_05840 [Cytobacillus solani]|uniref:Uncharacterized protein n=1 Tax=Cytobacillus solani TaxID=1637975 RepID=A0A0Q3T8Q3_9BACI|nr:hypothetical protein [Cytobacillus solani]KOP82818.1 hypothetical protein AMS60_10225 [Bacillus sp. FJAT-21945]KQL19837.1 hypothetical protein AN957_15535 [Cytobacillus solani]USK53074.1 hypothetical protein LIS82_15765 [Cytobacillus solani]